MADTPLSGNDDSHLVDDDADALIEHATNDDVGPEIGRLDDDGGVRGLSRDEAGRFAAREQDTPAGGDQNEGDKPAAPPTMKEVAEYIAERNRAEKAERELAELRGRMQPRQEERPDPLADPHLVFSDPKAFQEAMLARVQGTIAETREALRREAINADMEQTSQQHPELKEAWGRFVEACKRDPQLKQQFDTLPTYGRGHQVLAWDKRFQTMSAIPDGDLSKYDARRQDELLKDPAFLARAAEALRGQGAGLSTTGIPRPAGSNVTRLPSASRAGTAASAAFPAEPSDEDLLSQAIGDR